jgi:hypothetical protein
LQLGRTLLQRQGGTFAATHSASDGLELVFTLPASSQPARSALTRRVRRAPSLPCYR